MTPVYLCRTCGRPFTPTHDTNAPGPTSRHPYDPPDDEPIVGEVIEGHALLRDETGVGYARLYCACLQWEAVVTGYRSGEWARMEYREHAARANLAE